jgi:guanylate kinase
MLIAIAGPSTIGKDRMWTKVAEGLGFNYETPYTTRPKRFDESPDQEYHFVSIEQFQSMIRTNQITEWDYVLKNYYGTGITLRERILSREDLVLPVLGRMALRLKRAFPTETRSVMLTTSDALTLDRRLHERGYRDDDLVLRKNHAEEEALHAPLFDFVVPDADILQLAEITRVLHEIISTR